MTFQQARSILKRVWGNGDYLGYSDLRMIRGVRNVGESPLDTCLRVGGLNTRHELSLAGFTGSPCPRNNGAQANYGVGGPFQKLMQDLCLEIEIFPE